MAGTMNVESEINKIVLFESKLNLEFDLVSSIYQKIFNLFSDITLILKLVSEIEAE